MGFIKDVTGRFSLALLPLVVLSAAASLVMLLIGRAETTSTAAGKAVMLGPAK
jgi:hypothetical protein